MPFPKHLPRARTPDPRSAPILRWGIMGPGWIAERFVASLLSSTGQEVVAVDSRDIARARAFAGRYGIPRATTGRDLLDDPDLDAVYVATPHPQHLACAEAAMAAGKHVLVERPLALNAAQGRQLADMAARHGVVLIEAHMPDFLPKFDVLRQLLADGAVGQVCSLIANAGETFAPGHRIWRAELAGGPLLDLGVEVVALATGLLGRPEAIVARGTPVPGGTLNGQAAMVLDHPGGAQAVLHTTMLGLTPGEALISGTDGLITVPGRFAMPGPFTLTAGDRTTQLRYEEPRTRYAQLGYAAAHLARCVGEGLPESRLRPLSASILTLEVMDEARRQIGIVFDEERR